MAQDVIVRVDYDKLEDYDTLGHSKSTNFEKTPFPIRKDVFMMAATCGFLKNIEKELPKNTSDLFRSGTFQDHDIAAMQTMCIAYNKMEIDDKVLSLDYIIRQSEKWAQAGFKYLKVYTIQDSGLDNLYSLCDWITLKRKWYK